MPTLITISLSANNAGSSKNHNSSKAGNSYSCCTPSSNKKDAGRVTNTSTTSTSAGRAGEEDHRLSINLSRDPGPSAITNATASSTSAAVDTMNTGFSAASAAKRTSSASYSPVAFFADRLVEERIDALIEFNMKHGHSDVSEILAENPSLGNWCIYLREANKLKLVSEGNVQLLEKLGFDWNATNTGNQHASITPVVDLSRLYSTSKSAAIASSTREQELRFLPHHTRTTSSRISLPSSASSNPPRIITGTMMHRMPLAPTLTRRMIATQLPASSARRMTDVAARVPGTALTATTRRLVAAATRAPPPAAAVAAPQYVYQHPNQYCVYQIATNKNIPMPAAGEMVPPNFIPSPNTKNDTINNGQNNGYQQEREGTTTRSTIPQNPQQSAPLPVTKIVTKSSHLCGANHQGRVNMSEPSSQSFMVSSSSTSKVHIGQKRKYMHHQQEAPLLQFPIGLTFPSHQPPYLKSKNPVDNFGNASKAYIKTAVRSVVTNISPSAAPGTLSCYGDHLTPIMGRRIVDFIPTKEKNLVTAYTLMVISQLKVCRFTLQQKVGKRKDVFVGFPGMQCLHCEDHKQRRSGAYFPTSVKTLSDSKKILYAIAKHINKCTACPLEVKYSIARALVIHEIQRRAEKRHGSQRAFFGEVWRILHPNDESSKEIINAMFRPSNSNDQCFQNSNLVLSDAQQQEEVKSDQERSPNLTKKQQCANKASVSAGLLTKVTTIPYSLCASSILQQHCAIVTVAPTSTEQLSENSVIPASLPKSVMTDQQCATIVAPSSSTKQLSEISTTPVSLIVSITTEQHSATLVPPAFSKQRREKSTTPQ